MTFIDKTMVAPALVIEELQRVLNSEEMRNASILKKFLRFAVEKKLDGNAAELKEYTIGVKALGRPKDFNPQLDPIVRIHAGRLRRTLMQYYLTAGKYNEIQISIPKGTYIPQFETRKVEWRNAPAAFSPDSRSIGKLSDENPGTYNTPILSVFSFKNLSADNTQDYLVRGLTEQVGIDLARFKNVSVKNYPVHVNGQYEINQLPDPKTKMGIDYILSGSVRLDEDSIWINFTLTDAGSFQTIWTETYVRYKYVSNFFAIQEEIVDQVLNAIAGDYGIVVNLHKSYAPIYLNTEQVTAQKVIFQYYDYSLSYDARIFNQLKRLLEIAIKQQPSNALAHAALASLYMDMYAVHIKPKSDFLSRGKYLAEVANSLDVYCQHAQKALVWAFLFLGQKFHALERIDYCLSLNPKDGAIVANIGLALICLGEFDRGYQLLMKSIRLNPIVPVSSKLGFILFFFQKKDLIECRQWIQRLDLEKLPLLSVLHGMLIEPLEKEGSVTSGPVIEKKRNRLHSLIRRCILDESLRNRLLLL